MEAHVSSGAGGDDIEVVRDDLKRVRDDLKWPDRKNEPTLDVHRDVAAALTAALGEWLASGRLNTLRDALEELLEQLPERM